MNDVYQCAIASGMASLALAHPAFFVQTASINQAHVGNTDLITQVASYNYHQLLASLIACKGYRIRAVIFLGDAKYFYANAIAPTANCRG